MLLVDVHCHLNHEMFKDDLDEVIARARNADIKIIIQNGINSQSNKETLALAQKYDIVKPALGIYPLEALKRKEGDDFPRDEEINVDEELAFIESHKDDIVAIGEVGLDYKWVKDRCEEQKITFQKVLDLAKKINKPVIVHSRKAEADCIEMIKKSGVKAVLHCFGGKLKLVKEASDAKMFFSIPANVVKDQHFQQIVELVPLSQLLTETDSPYMGPVRGERNEPAHIADSIVKIAEIKGLTPEECSNVLFLNVQKLFL